MYLTYCDLRLEDLAWNERHRSPAVLITVYLIYFYSVINDVVLHFKCPQVSAEISTPPQCCVFFSP